MAGNRVAYCSASLDTDAGTGVVLRRTPPRGRMQRHTLNRKAAHNSYVGQHQNFTQPPLHKDCACCSTEAALLLHGGQMRAKTHTQYKQQQDSTISCVREQLCCYPAGLAVPAACSAAAAAAAAGLSAAAAAGVPAAALLRLLGGPSAPDGGRLLLGATGGPCKRAQHKGKRIQACTC